MPDLQQFGDDIWIVDGPIVRDAGLQFTTRMTIVRLTDGSLWVESPVELAPAVLALVKGFGPIRYIVSATQRHVWRLKAWHDLCPDAEPWAPVGARFVVGEVDFPMNDIFTDTPAPGWAEDLEQLAFRGSSVLREVVFFHRASRTVIVGDLIQVNPMMKGKPFRNAVFKALGAAEPNGGVARDIRISFNNRSLARESLKRFLSWDFDRLIIAHGACIDRDAKEFVREAFRWLSK